MGIIITKEKECQRKLLRCLDQNNTRKLNQLGCTKRVSSPVSEDLELINGRTKLWLPSKTANLRPMLSGTWVRELPMFTRSRTSQITPDTDAHGACYEHSRSCRYGQSQVRQEHLWMRHQRQRESYALPKQNRMSVKASLKEECQEAFRYGHERSDPHITSKHD